MRPNKIHIDYEFVCSECGAHGWLSKTEADTYGKWVCYCGVVNDIEIPHSISYHYSNKAKPPTPSPFANIPLNDIVDILVKLGYKSKEARRIVLDKVQKSGYNGKADDFVKELLKELKCPS